MLVETTSSRDRAIARTATRQPEGLSSVLAASSVPPMRTEAIDFWTTAATEFWDFTDHVKAFVSRSAVTSGQVTVYAPHTTASIVINEAETGFINDFGNTIESLVPETLYYEHDDHSLRTENLQEDEHVNGHAHCRQLLVGQPSVTVPVVAGQILLGRWQRIFFVELDQARPRRTILHTQGI